MATSSFDERQTARDLCIAFKHPQFRHIDTLDALRWLKRSRGETRV